MFVEDYGLRYNATLNNKNCYSFSSIPIHKDTVGFHAGIYWHGKFTKTVLNVFALHDHLSIKIREYDFYRLPKSCQEAIERDIGVYDVIDKYIVFVVER